MIDALAKRGRNIRPTSRGTPGFSATTTGKLSGGDSDRRQMGNKTAVTAVGTHRYKPTAMLPPQIIRINAGSAMTRDFRIKSIQAIKDRHQNGGSLDSRFLDVEYVVCVRGYRGTRLVSHLAVQVFKVSLSPKSSWLQHLQRRPCPLAPAWTRSNVTH